MFVLLSCVDVLVGSLLGIFFACLCYRQHYPPLQDADSHRPLHHREALPAAQERKLSSFNYILPLWITESVIILFDCMNIHVMLYSTTLMFVDLWVFILYTVIETFVIMSVRFLLVYNICSSLKSKALNVDHVIVITFWKWLLLPTVFIDLRALVNSVTLLTFKCACRSGLSNNS